MMLLKEGYGCIDEQLFEKCEFDLLARKVLGLEEFEDDIRTIAFLHKFKPKEPCVMLKYDNEYRT